MREQIKAYLDRIFAQAPCTQKSIDMKEAILSDVLEKYDDMVSGGMTEQEAYNRAVSGIGDLSKLIADLRAEQGTKETPAAPVQPPVDSEALQKYRQRSGLLVSIAVALYICCVLPVILIENVVGVVLMFLFVAVATGLLIYNAQTNPYRHIQVPRGQSVSAAEEADPTEHNPLFKAINGALWALIVAAYLIVSFATGAWHLTWLIFLIGAAVGNIIHAIFDLAGGNRK